MSDRIPPLKQADLPLRTRSFWRMTGPGAVMVGLAIGTGELIIWPSIVAQFGTTMIWAAAVGVFLQFWINLEIGRWAVATGESPYTGYARKWMGYVYLFIFINFILTFLPAWARTSGSALKAIIFGPDGPGADWVWTGITFLAIAGVLFGPKTIYTAVERSITAMVVAIVVGLLIVAFKVGTVELLGEMTKGFFVDFGRIKLEGDFTFARFFGAVVFAGAGGVGNLFYAYYLRDKQIGMGARIPKLMNPLRGAQEARVETGYIFPDTEENKRRFRDWFRYVVLDQAIYFWFLNSLVMFLFMFGAYAVLFPRGLVPEEGRLVWDMAAILAEVMGEPGRYIFLVIGMAALFSTQLGMVDGGSRTFADLLTTNFSWARRYSQSQWYLWVAVVTMVFGTASTWALEAFEITDLGFIFNNALIGGFAMAVYTPMTLYINLKCLPPSARPGPLNIAMVSLASAVYIGFALYTLWTVVAG